MTRVNGRDARASLVVVLVALPFCAGVSAACGVGFERGLLTAIVGGLVVGVLGGARLQISGPAVSMGAVLLPLVARHGVVALGPAVFLAGVFQILAAALRLGGLGARLPQAVIAGAVCAAGLVQAAAQIHSVAGAAAHPVFIANLLDLPWVLAAAHPASLLVAGATLAVALLWQRVAPGPLRALPAPVAAVIAGVLVAAACPGAVVHLHSIGPLTRVQPGWWIGFLAALQDSSLWATAALLAAMGTAESLASAEATRLTADEAGPLARHRELFAQGAGNVICGLAGALPLAGAIPRSAANARAGATGPAANVLHALLIGAVLVLSPGLLTHLPVPALSALLVLGGWRLAFERTSLTQAVEGAAGLGLFVTTLATGLAVNVPAGIAAGAAGGVLVMLCKQALFFARRNHKIFAYSQAVAG